HRTSRLEDAPRLLLGHRGHRGRRDAAGEERAQGREPRLCLRCVELDAIRARGSTARAPNSLVGVAHERLGLETLPHVTMDRGPGPLPPAAGELDELDVRSWRAGDQVDTKIEDADVYIPRHGKRASLNQHRARRGREEVAAHRARRERAGEI